MSNKTKILILLMLVFGACEDGYITKCDECKPENMLDVQLKIYVSSEHDSPHVVKIYEGPIEDGNLLAEVVTYGEYCEYNAMLYKDYSLSYTYVINSVRYTAIDRARPKVRHDENTCDEPCYYVYDNIVDLTLKYTK